MLTLPSKYIQSLFPHYPPGAANGWGWARSTERIEKKFTPPERWGYDPVDPASLPRSLEQARLPEEGGGGYQGRKGRKGVPGRGNSMTKDAEKRRPSVWLQWSEKWEEMQGRRGWQGPAPAESNTSLRSLSCVPWVLGAMDEWF